MAQTGDLDSVRAAALARIDRSERNFKLAFLAAAVVESAFIVSFVLLADLSNRLHLLLLISTVSCYSIIVLGIECWLNLLACSLLPLPQTTRDFCRQTVAQLTREHAELSTMMCFMSDEIVEKMHEVS